MKRKHHKFEQGFLSGIYVALQTLVVNHNETCIAEELITEIGLQDLLIELDDSDGIDSLMLRKVIGNWSNLEERTNLRNQLAVRLRQLRRLEISAASNESGRTGKPRESK